jgi:hypothetical protein
MLLLFILYREHSSGYRRPVGISNTLGSATKIEENSTNLRSQDLREGICQIDTSYVFLQSRFGYLSSDWFRWRGPTATAVVVVGGGGEAGCGPLLECRFYTLSCNLAVSGHYSGSRKIDPISQLRWLPVRPFNSNFAFGFRDRGDLTCLPNLLFHAETPDHFW